MKRIPEERSPFDRLVRGEITPVVAYESSLEGLKDSMIARQTSWTDAAAHNMPFDTGTQVPELERRNLMEKIETQVVHDDEFSSHNPEAVYRLLSIISDIKTSMLTTIDQDGTLRSRPMLTQDYQQDGTLWFFSSDHYGKAEELEADPRVNVTYAMPEKQRFISISGLAEIVHDEVKKRELWRPEFSEWFPEGKGDSHLALLKVYIQKAEYWDVPSNRLIEILSFTKAVLTGGTYHTAEPHQRIFFNESHA